MAPANLEQIRETLESLKDYDIHQDIKDTTPFDSEVLLDRYRQVRDEYLRRRILQTFLAVAERNDKEVRPPSEEEIKELENRQREVLSNVISKVQTIQEAKVDLQGKYAHFQSKRQALADLVTDMESSHAMVQEFEENDDDDVSDVDEAALQEQEQRLLYLQKRSAELKEKIRSIRRETREMESEMEKVQGGEASQDDAENVDPQELEQLREENDKLSAEVDRYNETREFYEKLVAVMEELSGIRILDVNPVGDPDSAKELALRIEVSGRHQLQIGLQPDSQLPDDLRVINAKFLTEPVVEGPFFDGKPLVRLEIPDLKDLVAISERSPPGENLRFVVREAVGRIHTLEARLHALVDLKTEAGVICNIGKLHSAHQASYGGQNQEVVCSLNQEQVSVVLCLTPDCPMVDNSVYISQLVGLGSWSDETMDHIRDSLDTYSRPLDLVRALRQEIECRVRNGEATLPRTPRLLNGGASFGK